MLERTIKELVAHVDMEEAMQLWYEEEKKKQIRVTVPLDRITFLRLEYVLKKIDMSKAEFMREILVASLYDIEQELGFTEEDQVKHLQKLIKEAREMDESGKVVEE